MLFFYKYLLPFLPLLSLVDAATKDDWRSRSIYQLLTDRFAPATDGAFCPTGSTNYCGGTWQTIIDKLGYIQGMGFDSIYISPTALNLEGATEYGYAYHGFWTADPTQTNPHFGSASDLKALSDAVHSRGMYLMADVAINALAATFYKIDDATLSSDDSGTLLFKSENDYHPRMSINFGNHTSEQYGWLATGDDSNGVALMDLATETDAVASVLKSWISNYTTTYGIDGLRIDAAKHMGSDFLHDFCEEANVFCIGEVAGDDTAYAATYQGDSGIDSVFGFGMLYGISDVFSGGKTMSTLSYYISQAASSYPDPTIIGTFIKNQDQPAFASRTQDASLIYNALVIMFLYGGIPITYYGFEAGANGAADPDNRAALWVLSPNYDTTGDKYQEIAKLNKIRSYLGSTGNFHNTVATVLTSQDSDIALQREELLVVLTSRGSSGSGSWSISGTSFGNSASVVDLLSCTNATTDASSALTVTWTTGQPFAFVAADVAAAGGFCGLSSSNTTTAIVTNSTSATSSFVSSTVSSSATGTASASSTGIVAVAEPSTTTSNTDVATTTDSTSDARQTTDAAATTSSTGECKRSRKRRNMSVF